MGTDMLLAPLLEATAFVPDMIGFHLLTEALLFLIIETPSDTGSMGNCKKNAKQVIRKTRHIYTKYVAKKFWKNS